MKQHAARCESKGLAATSWSFLGVPVCREAWKRLHCTGSHRANRLWDAVQKGAESPPMDLRFLKQPKAKVAGETSSARVISFLESIYHSIAETLPDIRDASLITQLQFQDGQEVHEVLQDEYSQSLSPEGRKELSAKLALTAGPAKGCRKRKFGLNLHLERRPGHAASTNEVRFLPPGVMKDYFEMMKAQDQCQGVSFSLFWRTWLIEFPHLVFRPTSMHSQCSTCIHHKILIRELAGHVAARQRQNDLYAEHLKAQYRDRQAYWSARGISRLQMATNLVVIIDGMDQSKWLDASEITDRYWQQQRGFADKREMPTAFVDIIKKHIPVLRSYNLMDAAEHFELWLNGDLEPAPPLDISACEFGDPETVAGGSMLDRVRRFDAEPNPLRLAGGGNDRKNVALYIKNGSTIRERVRGWANSPATVAQVLAQYQDSVVPIVPVGGLDKYLLQNFADEEWDNVTAISRAFSIGRSESQAVSNLQTKVDPEVLRHLQDAVSRRGMRSFLTHEVLLFLRRLCHDWDSQSEKMRKATSFKDARNVHITTGIFLHMLELLQQKAPASDFQDFEKHLTEIFMCGLMDAELLHIAEQSVPPADLMAVGAFRDKVKSYETKVAIETEDRKRALAEKVEKATFEQLESQINDDWRLIREQKGMDFTKEWMYEKCHLVQLPTQEKVTTALPAFNKFISQKQVSGHVYIIAAIDGTVWSQSDNMADMIQMMANVCSTGSTCIGYIQLPVMHSQTSMPALLKRKRLTEDTLLKINADFSTQITLLFSKESTRACTDKRLPSQMCVACAMGKNNRWIENSQPVQNGVMGPFALCAVADMMGYDADSKPGASAGEQPPVVYYGIMRDSATSQLRSLLETAVFKHWDGLATSPPKTRPREAPPVTKITGLSLLSVDAAGNPIFPTRILDKFSDGPHRKALERMRDDFSQEFPQESSRTGGGGTQGQSAPRVSGQCDFSIDDGKEALDVSRVVDVVTQQSGPDAADRTALHTNSCLGMGFNTGSFETKIVTAKRDSSGLPWRFVSDLDLVVVDKFIMPICKYFHRLATSQGLGDVVIHSHDVNPKMRPAESQIVVIRFLFGLNSKLCPIQYVPVFYY
ncbi:FO synthase subunit 1 [Durusdinium trenchii]|uniref:FO synthase subunit 1 n=1 Tax=Durusdinium trenchii TaxID=1381693 RepID=A0ABP0NQJ0_9DINO